MSELRIYHGSPEVVMRPSMDKARWGNDFGRGFYCTESLELAMEWACGDIAHDGYANEYLLDTAGFEVLDLEALGVLPWAATVIANRRVTLSRRVAKDNVEAFVSAYAVDLGAVDIVRGPRADDNYFDTVRYFADGGLTVAELEGALRLGGLGEQIVLKSLRAFAALRFQGTHAALAREWYPLRKARNIRANDRGYDECQKRRKTGTSSLAEGALCGDGRTIRDIVDEVAGKGGA